MARLWAQAAHDLRQPLQTARLLAATLDGASARAELMRRAQGIGWALESLQEMLEVLALLARVQAGQQVVALGPCQLADALELAARELAVIAARRSIPLRMRKLQGAVRSHPKLLAAAARSLFLNAVRFGDGSGIRVGCRRGGGQVTIEVEFGGGPSDAAIEKHAFVQLMPSGDGHGAGELGLGLALLAHLCPTLGADLHHTGRAPGRQLLALMLPLPGG
jgi:signal transduction histidine kinase